MKSHLTIEELIPDSDNANRGSERGSGLLENMLRTHGAARSIVIDADNKVIAGNQVLQAAVNAGIQRIRVIETNGQELVAVRRSDVKLNSKMGRELALADNAVALRSINLDGHVIARQAEEFEIDLNDCGISEAELKQLLKDAAEEQPHEADQQLPNLEEQFLIVVRCANEGQQLELLERFKNEGLNCTAQSV